MISRQLVCVGVAAVVMTAGCSGNLLNKPPESKVESTAPRVDTKGAPESHADAETVEALTRKAEAHAQRVAPPAQNPRGRNSDSQQSQKRTPPTEQPSDVAWMDADELRLTPEPQTYSERRREATPPPPPAPEPAPQARTTPPPPTPPAQSTPPNPAPAPSGDSTAQNTPSANTPPPALDAQANAPVAVPAAHQEKPEGMNDSGYPDELRQRLAQRVKDYPRDIAGHLDYQLAMFLNDESVPDMAAIASLPAEDREVVTTVLDGLSNFRSTVRADNNTMLSRKIRPLLDMADRLRNQADLSISTLALCTKVDKFGDFQPLEPAKFIAGKVNQTIIYCEIDNFASALNNNKLWETKLTQEAVLYDDTGLPVWDLKSQTISDTSRNRRRDFFVATKINLPSNLAIGRYLLKVTIVDQQASRVAESTVPILIVAQ